MIGNGYSTIETIFWGQAHPDKSYGLGIFSPDITDESKSFCPLSKGM
jgi:hypothetical protein